MNPRRWERLCRRMECASVVPRFNALADAYSEDHRRYHTGRHIDECLSLFDALRDLCDHPDEVEYAIWLHDVVYRSRRSDNEERSADIAIGWLAECQVEKESIERVRGLILTTTHSDRPRTRDERVIVDIDLHILGADSDRFDEYEAQVRGEYRWVPAPIYRRRRAQILQHFLSRDPLYNTERCRAWFEASAKENLSRSLARLARG